jgi:hypothetical protein
VSGPPNDIRKEEGKRELQGTIPMKETHEMDARNMSGPPNDIRRTDDQLLYGRTY